MIWPSPRLSRWIRDWVSLCDPHYLLPTPTIPPLVSEMTQLMPRYRQHNVIPVHRRRYCHADNGARKMRQFSKLPCRMPELSSPSQQHLSNSDWISGVVLTQAIRENRLRFSISQHRQSIQLRILLISLKGYVTLQINGISVAKYGNHWSATAFQKSEMVSFSWPWIFPLSWYTVKQTEQHENLCKNLILGTETPATIVPAAITAAVVYPFCLPE